MKGEIDKDFYCSVLLNGGKCIARDGDNLCAKNCPQRHRKWPTPEQYKKEYDNEYPEYGAVYSMAILNDTPRWVVGMYGKIAGIGDLNNIVCACTPWGKPPNDWRPELNIY